jgi:DNA polymerase-3 subunit beta
MVLVKAKRDDLLGPLSAVSGIIERRHTLPILSNVLLERSAGKISFLATDIEVQIRRSPTWTGAGSGRHHRRGPETVDIPWRCRATQGDSADAG